MPSCCWNLLLYLLECFLLCCFPLTTQGRSQGQLGRVPSLETAGDGDLGLLQSAFDLGHPMPFCFQAPAPIASSGPRPFAGVTLVDGLSWRPARLPGSSFWVSPAFCEWSPEWPLQCHFPHPLRFPVHPYLGVARWAGGGMARVHCLWWLNLDGTSGLWHTQPGPSPSLSYYYYYYTLFI